MVPAQEGLDPFYAIRFCVNNRLIGKMDFSASERIAKILFQCPLVLCGLQQLIAEQAIAAAACGFGCI